MQKANRPKSKPKMPRKPRSQGVKVRSTRAPAAVSSAATDIGMRDLQSHKQSWIAGYLSVGDGTNGATDYVYFQTAALSKLVPGNSGGGQVPILGSDTQVGKTYISDLRKHFSRIVIKKCRVHIVPLYPSTANSLSAYVAPIRGSGQAGDTVTFWGATTAPPSISNVIGMQGVAYVSAWQQCTLDLTPYIAGGSGAKQNEFNLSRDAESASTAWGDGGMDLNGISPCGIVCTGLNTTTALRGLTTHLVVVEQEVDLLDFIAGMSLAVPESWTVEQLESILSGLKPGAVAASFVQERLMKLKDKPC